MIRAAFSTLVVLAMATVLATPAGAHTAMLQASPDRDGVVGGPVTVIDLEFLDPITDAVVSVTYNGVPVAGRTTVADGKLITFALDQPLSQPGRYQVSYEMISFDSDFTTGGFFFSYDPAAAPAERLELPSSSDVPSITLVLAGAGLAILAGFLVVAIVRIERRRRQLIVEMADDEPLLR